MIANMRQAGLNTTQMVEAKALPTPIRHLYSLSDSHGKFLSLVNEAGTFFGGSADAGQVAGGAAVASSASPAAQPGKINTKDVLMKLFK